MEDTLDLLSPGLTTVRLGAVVRRMHAFVAGTEPHLVLWAQRRPADAAALDWPRRRRAAVIAADLPLLGLRPLPPAAPVLTDIGTAAAFGWLYVLEGSTLGGAIIARRLAPLLGGLPGPLRTFSPYAEGPGPMWQAFGAALEDWVGADDLRARDVADAAVHVFAALDEWVAPLRDGAAA